jgi:hypothetical protein
MCVCTVFVMMIFQETRTLCGTWGLGGSEKQREEREAEKGRLEAAYASAAESVPGILDLRGALPTLRLR